MRDLAGPGMLADEAARHGPHDVLDGQTSAEYLKPSARIRAVSYALNPDINLTASALEG